MIESELSIKLSDKESQITGNDGVTQDTIAGKNTILMLNYI